MKRLILTVAAVVSTLTVTAKVQAESLISPNFPSRVHLLNRNWGHHKALHQVQEQMQQLARQQAQRAQRGLRATPAMWERGRQLALQAAYHEEMIRATNGMINQARRQARRHHWEMTIRHILGG